LSGVCFFHHQADEGLALNWSRALCRAFDAQIARIKLLREIFKAMRREESAKL
jgi:hypothetical protein